MPHYIFILSKELIMKSIVVLLLVMITSAWLGVTSISNIKINAADAELLTKKYDLNTENWSETMIEKNKPWLNTSQKVVATYFTEWSVFSRKYNIESLPAENVTHVLYAFIGVCGENKGLKDFLESSWEAMEKACIGKEDYTVAIHDPYAALQKPFKGDKKEQALKGNYAQMIRLKDKYPHIKILPSIAGWTLSDPMFALAPDPVLRKRFIDSVEVYLRQWPFFDGIDVDWEFPGGWGNNSDLGDAAIDGPAYVVLMKELREMLDRLGDERGVHLELTSAVGTAKRMVDVIDYKEVSQYMDYIFAMTYDFHGAWENQVGHAAALYGAEDDVRPDLNVHDRIQYMLDAGIPKHKLVLGAPIYGRAWSGVKDIKGDNPFSGVASGPAFGTWEPGAYDFDHLRLQYISDDWTGKLGFEMFYDEEKKASWMWRERDGTLISFDSPQVIEDKANYVMEHDLAGIFTWEVDSDNGEVMNAIHRGLGHTAVDENNK
jgi:chitinase